MATMDNIWAMVSFFGLAIFFIALMIAWNVLSGEATDLWTGSSIGGEIQNNAQNAANNFDFMVVMAYIGLHLGILVTAFLLRTHPVIYIASIFIIVTMALLAAPLSNAYGDLNDDAELTNAINSYPMSNYVLSNLPKLEIIFGFVTVVVMFGLARSEGFI